MTEQRVVEPSPLGEGQNALVKRLKRFWISLTTEEIFHEDGTSARRTMVCRAVLS